MYFSPKTGSSILLAVLIVIFSLSASPVRAQTSIHGVSDPTNITGLISCTSVSFFQSVSNLSCGDKFKDSGSFTIGDPVTGNKVPYVKDDIVKCSWIPLTSSASCLVTHPDKTYTAYETSIASGALTTTPLDSNGKQNGAATQQSATDATFVKPVVNGVSDALKGIGGEILKAVGTAILTFANFLLGMAGVLFNLVMVYGVFQFGNTIGNSPGVLTAWGILRDLANMALLFGFIFMGVATILDTGGVQQFTAKNALPKLIIFAILMNFSLFACEAVIDISNALTSSMYSQANTEGNSCFKPAGLITGTDCGLNYGIAGHIMQSTGLSGIWSGASTPDLSAVQYLMLALFATIGAIVFFAASIMLAIRLIVLTLLMVTSPIGFAGMAIPPLRKLSDQWWNKVFHQAFYAPIMLLMILISLKIADTFTQPDQAGGHANQGLAGSAGTIGKLVTSPNASSMEVVLVFTIIIGFMVASLIVANRFGAMGAAGAVNFGKKVVLGSYGGVAGFAGRRSIGAASSRIQKSYKSNTSLRRFAVKTGLDGSILKATEAGKNAKFGSSKSFADKEEKGKKDDKTLNYLKTIKKVQDAKDTSSMSSAIKDINDADLLELVKQFKGNKDKLRLISEAASAERLDKLLENKEFDDEDTKMKMRNLRYMELTGNTESKGGARREDLVKTARDAEMAYMRDPANAALKKDYEDARADLAGRDGLVKAARDAEMAYMRDPANAALKKDYEDSQKNLSNKVKSLGGKDAGILARSKDAGLLNDPLFTGALSDDQAKAFKGNENLTPQQKSMVEDSRNARHNDVNIIALNMPSMNTEAINKLKGDVLANTKVLNAMDGRQLAKIDLDKLNKKQADDIVSHVKTLLATPVITVLSDPELKEKILKFRAQAGAVPKLEQQWRAEKVIV